MVKVTNIKVSTFDLSKDTASQALKKCLDLAPAAREFLPTKPKYTVSFELKETNTDMANAIRRCLINEIPVKSFSYDEYKDADVSDVYILSDVLRKQVELTPINQDFDYSDCNISLIAENKEDHIISVVSGDFIITKKDKPIDVTDVVNSNIVLCRLRPQEHVYIKNIKIDIGTGREDAGKYSSFSNITYKIMDVQHATAPNGKSSMLCNPAHFYISYSTHRNIDIPFKYMCLCCDTLIERLEVIVNDLKNIRDSDEFYYSNKLELTTKGSMKMLHIKGEYWTLTNVICRYAYIATKSNIKFIAPALLHPEIEVGVINIIHPEFSKLLQNSIKNIIADLQAIRSEFED